MFTITVQDQSNPRNHVDVVWKINPRYKRNRMQIAIDGCRQLFGSTPSQFIITETKMNQGCWHYQIPSGKRWTLHCKEAAS